MADISMDLATQSYIYYEPKKYNNNVWTDCNKVTREICNMHPIHLWYTIKFIENHRNKEFMDKKLKNMRFEFKKSGYTDKDVKDSKFGLQSGLLCMYPKESVEVNTSLCYWCLEI